MSRESIEKPRQTLDYLSGLASGYASMGVHIVAQMILVPVYLETLGRYQFGVLMVLLAIVNLTGIGIGWMSGGVLRICGEYAATDDRGGLGRAYAVSKAIHLAYAAAAAATVLWLGLAFGDRVFEHVPFELEAEVRAAVVALAFYLLVYYDFAVERLTLFALKRQTAANLFQIVTLVVFFVSALAWLGGGGGLSGVVLCLLGSVGIARAGVWLYWRHLGYHLRMAVPDRRDVELLKRLTGRMGLGYAIYGALILTLQADTILVGWLGGAEMVAEFILVWKIAEVLVQLLWRAPEYLQPYVIQMDARGERERIGRLGKEGVRWMVLASTTAALGYALLGPSIVAIWVGVGEAPDNRWAYVLAGSAIFWLGIARLPAVLAYATVRLRSLIRVAGAEVLGKLVLTVALFPRLGYAAPLAAINLVHLGGVALAYRWLLRKI